MRTITTRDLAELRAQAQASPRRRANLNLHPQLTDANQRFFNAIEPGSYVRPHRHLDPPRWEAFAALAGSAVVLTFDDHGRVLDRCELSPGGPAVVVEIPAGAWHTLTATSAGTLLFEIKPGPFRPIPEGHFATWAPLEGTTGADRFERWFRSALPGDSPPPVDDRSDEPA